jgi:serine/threonine protein kinase/tetratricopeptide (TPR) repeat protein
MEELIAACLRTYEETGDAGLRRFLDAHPRERADLEICVAELRAFGLAGPIDGDAPATEETPRRLGGFELRDRLGGGGMGIVYRAWQPDPGREVALKIVRGDRRHLQIARERFRREARALAAIHHPGIVPLFAVGEDQGVPWIAMELVDGRTLEQIVASLGASRPSALRAADLARALDPERSPPATMPGTWTDACVEIAAQVADALCAAHAADVLHRDVKPSNVIVTRDGRAQLLDFGLARSIDRDAHLTRTGDSVGSPIYMAPEQLRGGAVGPHTDVYGLGVTLYELLALEPPFVTDDETALRNAILQGAGVPLRHRNPSVPRDVETLVARAIDPDPRRRIADAASLRDDLRRVLARQPIHARRTGPWLHLVRFCQRRPAVAALSAMAVLVALGLPTAIGLEQARSRRAVEIQREIAEANLDTALLALDRFLARFGADELTFTPGLDAVGGELLAEAIALYERLDRARPEDGRVRLALADARRRAAWRLLRIGDHEAATALAEAARAGLPPPVDATLRKAHGDALGTRAGIERARDDLEASEATLREALALLRPDGDAAERGRRTELRIALGRVLADRGRSAASAAEFSLALRELGPAEPAPSEPEVAAAVALLRADALRSLATTQIRMGRPAEAEDALVAALALLEPRLESGPRSTGDRQLAAEVHGRLAAVLASAGKPGPSRSHYESCFGLYDALVRDFPAAVAFRRALVLELLTAASSMPLERSDELLDRAIAEIGSVPSDDTAAAVLLLRAARVRLERHGDDTRTPAAVAALTEAVARVDTGATLAQLPPRDLHQFASALHALASVDVDAADAEPRAARAVELKQRVVDALAEDIELRDSLANSLGLLGLARAHAGRPDEALTAYDAAIGIREALLADRGDAPSLENRHAGVLCNAANTARSSGDPTRALTYATRAETHSEAAISSSGRASWRRRLFVARYIRAEALLDLDRLAELRSVTERILHTKDDVEDAISAASLLARGAARAAALGDDQRDQLEGLAVAALATAGARGFTDWDKVPQWAEFAGLREREDFLALVDRR